ncbi:hypothetical protein [Candidatus Methanoperedens nitratireducens]|uniref:hypothetical protein n=1 Tax=Candidatus Methanoperedens nitratireducens TaxID=1392998 RepID=UPI001178A138|nr:hypothetical protein [Candidatus Methanoperedens nitroreducens]
MIIFYVIVLYSFIGWYVNDIYNTEDENAFLFTYGDEFNTSHTNEDSFGSGFMGYLEAAYEYGNFLWRLASFQDSRIPSVVNMLVILPHDLMLIGAGVFLIRGGGS